jgi:hypothetical protein
VAAKRKPAPPPAEPVDRSSFITVAEPEPDPEDVPSMMPVLEPEPEPPPLEQAPPHSLKPYEPEPPPPGPPPAAPAPAPTPEPERELESELQAKPGKLGPEPEHMAPIPLLAPPSCPAAAGTRRRLHRAAPCLGIEILFRDMGAYGPASNATAPDLMQRHRRAKLLPKQLSFLVHTKSWSGATTSIQLQTVNRRSTFDARCILPSLHEPRSGWKMCLGAFGAARRRSTHAGRRVPPRYPQ